MCLNRLLPFAAAALLAACNPQTADRSGSARAPIPAAQAPVPAAASAACPETPAPACVAEKAKASAKPAWRGTKVATRHKVVAHKAAAEQPRRTYRRYEALAGGPQPHSDYARAPRRDYARVPQDDYANGPATAYRFGPAYPPAVRPDDRGDDRYEQRRYEDEAYGRQDRRDLREPPREDRFDRSEGRTIRRGPPPEDRYGPGRPSSRQDDEALYAERYGVRRHEGVPQPPPVFDRPDGRVYDGRASEKRSYEGHYESRSESRSTYESQSARRDDGPCCHAEAAGFDPNGFLTWPGKVPARAR